MAVVPLRVQLNLAAGPNLEKTMPEIDGRALMMAIQAVDFKINDIAKQLVDSGEEDGGELELLLLGYEKAAASLKIGYEEALKTISNLPPYETLVRV
jgi:hypothetical protein